MREPERVAIPLPPISLPSLIAVPRQRRTALAAFIPSQPGGADAEYALWRAALGGPIARANAPLPLQTKLLGGGYPFLASSALLGQIAIGGTKGVLQFDAETLALRAAWTLPNLRRAEGLAYSPDGRFLAVANGREQVSLVPLRQAGAHAGLPEGAEVERLGQVTPSGVMSGGENTGRLIFTPDGRTLIAGCSFQGGTSLSLADVGEGSEFGALLNPRELNRSDNETPDTESCDMLNSLAVSPSGRFLALFETRGASVGKAPGWRGILSIAEAPFTEIRWSTPIDARLTGDSRPLEALRFRDGGGYHTEVVFLGEDEVVCGAPGGHVFCFDPQSGTLRRELALPEPYQSADVWRLAAGETSGDLWCMVLVDDACQIFCLDTRHGDHDGDESVAQPQSSPPPQEVYGPERMEREAYIAYLETLDPQAWFDEFYMDDVYVTRCDFDMLAQRLELACDISSHEPSHHHTVSFEGVRTCYWDRYPDRFSSSPRAGFTWHEATFDANGVGLITLNPPPIFRSVLPDGSKGAPPKPCNFQFILDEYMVVLSLEAERITIDGRTFVVGYPTAPTS